MQQDSDNGPAPDRAAAEGQRPAPFDEAGSGAGTPPQDAAGELGSMVDAGSGMVRDFLELLAVEGRLAGRSLAVMLALAVVLGLLLVATWLFVAGAAGLMLIEHDILSPPLALLATAGGNVLLALVVWLVIRHLSGNLAFREFIGAVGSILPGSRREQGRENEQ